MTSAKRWVMAMLVMAAGLLASAGAFGQGDIDFERARGLMQRQQRGETLTQDEQAYLQRAVEARGAARGRGAATQTAPGARNPAGRGAPPATASTGLVPLTEMSKDARYKGEDGGLYGEGRNEPPAAHAEAARKQLSLITPLDAEGKPSPDGKIVLLSLGMSNTTQEFSNFKTLAQRDTSRSRSLVIVDGAFGGQDVVAWAESRVIPQAGGTPWDMALNRLKEAGVTPKQVQVMWLKQAKMGPAQWGEFPAHARKLADGMATILNMSQEKYPNLRVAYLSSRIYAGYATTGLNPEPYSYESGFSCRWLIQEQIKGQANLNYDPAKGRVLSPPLLWGPYLWGDGTTPRKADGLVWNRADLTPEDGTHPSAQSGQAKVGQMLLKFFQADPLARVWYLSPEAPKAAPAGATRGQAGDPAGETPRPR